MRTSLAVSLFAATAIQMAAGACAKECIDLNVKVPIKVRQGKFNPKAVAIDDTVGTVALNTAAITRNVNNTAKALTGYYNSEKTYDIHATYCKPSGGEDNGVMLFLTHGIGYDGRYWDFGTDKEEYSFVNHATKVGYHTFAIDRLGVGKSTIPDIWEPQFPTAVEINIALSRALRAAKVDKRLPKPKKLVHVGHSYGSIISNAVASWAPDCADAVVLTGYSTDLSYIGLSIAGFNFRNANQNQPDRFGKNGKDGERPNGYITWADQYHAQFNFFLAPHFDPAVLARNEKIKMPLPIGEFLTIGTWSTLAPNFKNPVLLISGNADSFFCGGDCVSEGYLEKAKESFPASNNFKSYVQPNTGHGMNMHKNATGTYDVIVDFLQDNKL